MLSAFALLLLIPAIAFAADPVAVASSDPSVAARQRWSESPHGPMLEVNTPRAEAFRLACQQCHVLPDPRRHTAREWPAVVERMQKNMEWMNRVVGSKPAQDEPQLRIADINAFLARHARSPQ